MHLPDHKFLSDTERYPIYIRTNKITCRSCGGDIWVPKTSIYFTSECNSCRCSYTSNIRAAVEWWVRKFPDKSRHLSSLTRNAAYLLHDIIDDKVDDIITHDLEKNFPTGNLTNFTRSLLLTLHQDIIATRGRPQQLGTLLIDIKMMDPQIFDDFVSTFNHGVGTKYIVANLEKYILHSYNLEVTINDSALELEMKVYDRRSTHHQQSNRSSEQVDEGHVYDITTKSPEPPNLQKNTAGLLHVLGICSQSVSLTHPDHPSKLVSPALEISISTTPTNGNGSTKSTTFFGKLSQALSLVPSQPEKTSMTANSYPLSGYVFYEAFKLLLEKRNRFLSALTTFKIPGIELQSIVDQMNTLLDGVHATLDQLTRMEQLQPTSEEEIKLVQDTIQELHNVIQRSADPIIKSNMVEAANSKTQQLLDISEIKTYKDRAQSRLMKLGSFLDQTNSRVVRLSIDSTGSSIAQIKEALKNLASAMNIAETVSSEVGLLEPSTEDHYNPGDNSQPFYLQYRTLWEMNHVD